jgi:hypothetical protein
MFSACFSPGRSLHNSNLYPSPPPAALYAIFYLCLPSALCILLPEPYTKDNLHLVHDSFSPALSQSYVLPSAARLATPYYLCQKTCAQCYEFLPDCPLCSAFHLYPSHPLTPLYATRTTLCLVCDSYLRLVCDSYLSVCDSYLRSVCDSFPFPFLCPLFLQFLYL